MIDDCGARRGARSIMVVSVGFAEAGEEGRALQAELRAAALRTAIPVLGPNVEGFVNYVDHVAPYGTDAARRARCRVDQRHLAVGDRRLDDEPARVGPRRWACGSSWAWATRPCSGSATCSRGRPPTRTRRSSASYIETMRDVEGIGRGLDALLRRAQAGR